MTQKLLNRSGRRGRLEDPHSLVFRTKCSLVLIYEGTYTKEFCTDNSLIFIFLYILKGLTKQIYFCYWNSATPVHRLCVVLQLKLLHLNRTALQYQTRPVDMSGAVPGGKIWSFSCLSYFMFEDFNADCSFSLHTDCNVNRGLGIVYVCLTCRVGWVILHTLQHGTGSWLMT